MPSPAARSFIIFTKASSLPAMYSAMAVQASLALATEIHFNIVSTLCVSPGSKNTWEPPMDAAYSEVDTSSSSAIFPSSSASKIKSIVMIFVTLAGARLVSASFSYNTAPVDASIKTALGACTSTSASCCPSVFWAASGSSARVWIPGTTATERLSTALSNTARTRFISILHSLIWSVTIYYIHFAFL